MPRALELSGDGGPDARCPTCQSILAWQPAHDGWVGETTHVAEALLCPNTQLRGLRLACPPTPLASRPGRLGRAVRRMAEVPGRGRSALHLQPKGPKGSGLPATGTDPELPPWAKVT